MFGRPCSVVQLAAGRCHRTPRSVRDVWPNARRFRGGISTITLTFAPRVWSCTRTRWCITGATAGSLAASPRWIARGNPFPALYPSNHRLQFVRGQWLDCSLDARGRQPFLLVIWRWPALSHLLFRCTAGFGSVQRQWDAVRLTLPGFFRIAALEGIGHDSLNKKLAPDVCHVDVCHSVFFCKWQEPPPTALCAPSENGSNVFGFKIHVCRAGPLSSCRHFCGRSPNPKLVQLSALARPSPSYGLIGIVR